jgi:alkylhydroperoxidase family enzyme
VLLGDRALVDLVLADPSSPDLPAKDRALFAFLAVAARDTHTVSGADCAVARAAGWSDEALYDAITVVALFRFYNTWVDAAGVCDMSEADYAASGQRIATVGYASAEPGG